MAFTYGFYNSVNSDRRYDAIQMSSLFDGIICDGVLSQTGDAPTAVPSENKAMTVVPADGGGLAVKVRPGRAWFNHTWSLLDADYPLSIQAPHVAKPRIDAVVLEVNSNVTVRQNSLKILMGAYPEGNDSPSRPSMVHDEYVNQYPLAYVYVEANATDIKAANITNAIGTSECPISNGLMEQITADTLLENWASRYNELEEGWRAEFNVWYNGMRHDLIDDDDTAARLENKIYEVERTVSKSVLYRYETTVGVYVQDNTYFKSGVRVDWPIPQVTSTSFPNYIVDPNNYDGDIVCVTSNALFSVHFEVAPANNLPITLLWEETEVVTI